MPDEPTPTLESHYRDVFKNDVERVRGILTQLEYSTRGPQHVRRLQRTQRTDDGPAVVGSANRPGLLYLGLLLALAALDAETKVTITPDGLTENDPADPGLIEITIVDDPPIEPDPRPWQLTLLLVPFGLLWIAALGCMAVGLFTIVRWIYFAWYRVH